MQRRDLLKTGAAITASAVALGATVTPRAIGKQLSANSGSESNYHVWDRPLHTVYAGNNRTFLDNTDKDLLDAWDQVQGGITAMTPFLLNVSDPSPFAPMIKAVQANGVVIVPGVGGPAAGPNPVNYQGYKDIARAYRDYTDHVRIENCQGFIWKRTGDTIGQMQDMIDYLTGTLEFKHVMLNPWPEDLNGDIIPFTNPELDASFNEVHYPYPNQITDPPSDPPGTAPYPPNLEEPDPTNPTEWRVDKASYQPILDYRSTVKIIVNYESPPQHQALADLETNIPGSSEWALNVTAKQCENDKKNLYWAPPFTHVYDPLDLNTWNWIARRLGEMP